MNFLFCVLSMFLFKGVFAEEPAQYTGRDPVNEVKRFVCHDIQIEKVNFDFCSSGNPRMHGTEKNYDQKIKNVSKLQNGRFLKFNDCSIQVKERGRSKTYYDIVDTKPNCTPGNTTAPFCETIEDTVKLIGPHCNGTKAPSEQCSFTLQHKFNLGDVASDQIAYDSRRMCHCNDKACGHLLKMIEKKNAVPFTNEEKASVIEQIKKDFKVKTPECDDVVVKDASTNKNSHQMYFALSSAKCPIIYEPYIQSQHCPPWKVRGVERIGIKNPDGREEVVAAVCVKRAPQSYVAPKEENSRR